VSSVIRRGYLKGSMVGVHLAHDYFRGSSSPAYVLTAALAPLGKDFAPVSGAAAYPEKTEGWVCRERKLLLSADVWSLRLSWARKWKMFSHRAMQLLYMCQRNVVYVRVFPISNYPIMPFPAPPPFILFIAVADIWT